MFDLTKLDQWHPLTQREEHAKFPEYLAEIAAMAAQAREWADHIPEENQHDQIGYPSIPVNEVKRFEPMPFWMRRILDQEEKTVFNDGSAFYSWPFYWLGHPADRGKRLATSEDVVRWEALFHRWLGLSSVNAWNAESDPAALHYPRVISGAPGSISGATPSQKWRRWASERAAPEIEPTSIHCWIESLGSRANLSRTHAFWPDLATYWSLLFEYEATYARDDVKPLSAARRATRQEPGHSTWLAASISSIKQKLGNPDPDPSQSPARTRALRQFTYWGRLPFLDDDALTAYRSHWPTDPRMLSIENEHRAVALVWLIREAMPSKVARPLIERMASDLSLRLFSRHSGSSGGNRERSYRGASAAIRALHEIGAKSALRKLAPKIEGPKLAKLCAELADA